MVQRKIILITFQRRKEGQGNTATPSSKDEREPPMKHGMAGVLRGRRKRGDGGGGGGREGASGRIKTRKAPEVKTQEETLAGSGVNRHRG